MTVERILVLGNVNVDLVMGEIDGWPQVGTEVILPRSEMRPGGSAGNTALALSGLGVPHRLVAGVGVDMMGDWLAAQFDPAYSTWIVMDCATTVTVGIVHHGGDRAFFTTTGHLHESRLEDLATRIPAAPDEQACALISGGFLMPHIEAGTAELIPLLQNRGWRVAIDPGWPSDGWSHKNVALARRWLGLADIALINAEEARGMTARDDLDAAVGDLASSLSANQMLVVKCGAEGVSVHAGGRDGNEITVAAPEVEVVDTVGAGDTFNAAFLATLTSGSMPAEAAARGVRSASIAISTYPRRYDT